MQLSDLIERVENAEGPQLVLDGMIWCAVNGYEFVEWDGAGCVYRDHAVKWDSGIRHVDRRRVPPVTASLDDAMALKDRLLPGIWWLLARGRLTASEPEYGAQLLFGPDEVVAEGEGPTPAIALVLATLRAYAATHPAEDGR